MRKIKDAIIDYAIESGYEGEVPRTIAGAVDSLAGVAGGGSGGGDHGGGGAAGYDVERVTVWAVPEQTVTSENMGDAENPWYVADVTVGDLAKMYENGQTALTLTVDGVESDAVLQYNMTPMGATYGIVRAIADDFGVYPNRENTAYAVSFGDTEPTAHTVSCAYQSTEVTTTEDFNLAVSDVTGYSTSVSTTQLFDEQEVTFSNGHATLTPVSGVDINATLAQMYAEGNASAKVNALGQTFDAAIDMNNNVYAIVVNGVLAIYLDNGNWVMQQVGTPMGKTTIVSVLAESIDVSTTSKFDAAVAKAVGGDDMKFTAHLYVRDDGSGVVNVWLGESLGQINAALADGKLLNYACYINGTLAMTGGVTHNGASDVVEFLAFSKVDSGYVYFSSITATINYTDSNRTSIATAPSTSNFRRNGKIAIATD